VSIKKNMHHSHDSGLILIFLLGASYSTNNCWSGKRLGDQQEFLLVGKEAIHPTKKW
jgi:hypothetical protein